MLPDASSTTATVAPDRSGLLIDSSVTLSSPGAGRGSMVIGRLPSVSRFPAVR